MAYINDETKNILDKLLLDYKIQPVGWGYVDCITVRENVSGFIKSLTELGIKVTDITWWCHYKKGCNKETGCHMAGEAQ